MRVKRKSGTVFRFEVSMLLRSLTTFDERAILLVERHYHKTVGGLPHVLYVGADVSFVTLEMSEMQNRE